MDRAREKLPDLPDSPGVYLFKDAGGKIIYVGKAKVLKNRVRSYFQKQDSLSGYKTKALVKEIVDFEIMLCQSETEAFLLERTLIKHHAPRFNILLRDDKEYPYVRIDYQESWPRIRKVRQRQQDGAVYIGPFGFAGALNEALRMVHRIFPLVRCSEHEFKNAKRPCNYYAMKLCHAPCVYSVDREKYLSMVRDAEALLRGEKKGLVQRLEDKMHEAAEKEAFEDAAVIRDQLKSLEKIASIQIAVVSELEEGDCVLVLEHDELYVFHVLMVRQFRVIGGDYFCLSRGAENLQEALATFLLQYYEDRYLPSQLIVEHKPSSPEDLVLALCHQRDHSCRISLARGEEKRQLMSLARKNAGRYFQEHLTSRKNRGMDLVLLAESLKLNAPPKWIECIDVSHTMGQQTVASLVAMTDGKPNKSLYRRFRLESMDGKPDDFASIAEVVTRRLRRYLEEGEGPDLLVIDGGKGQLSAALKAAETFDQKGLPPMVGLAKSRVKGDFAQSAVHHSSERVFLNLEDPPLILEPGSSAFRILTLIRDEAHRFAITYHRKQRQKSFHASALDGIKGVGPKIKQNLLRTFQSIDSIRQASAEDLQRIRGITQEIAQRILKHLEKPKDN